IKLVTDLTSSPKKIIYRSFSSLAWLFIAIDLFLPPILVLIHFSTARTIFKVLIGIYYIYMAARSIAKKNQDAWTVLLGVVLYVTGSRLDMLVGIPVRDYGVSAFALCMLFALTSRHARLRNRFVEISGKLLDAHEEERRRLARDIHDGIGQSLLGLKLRLQMLASKVKSGFAPAPETFESLVGSADSIIEEVRRTSMDLRPSFIENISLADAIKWYTETFAGKGSFEIFFHEGKDPVPEPVPRIKDNLYRIFQEIISNAVKHSLATRVDISLYYDGKTLTLIAMDNGVGFLVDENRSGGIGLKTMRERAALIGGKCRIESSPGTGTTVRVEVPLT
ncbi:sensor histidine kinase, partial [bacterium]